MPAASGNGDRVWIHGDGFAIGLGGAEAAGPKVFAATHDNGRLKAVINNENGHSYECDETWFTRLSSSQRRLATSSLAG